MPLWREKLTVAVENYVFIGGEIPSNPPRIIALNLLDITIPILIIPASIREYDLH